PTLTRSTRLALLPLIDSSPAPGPVMMVAAESVSVSWPPVRAIVRGVLNTVLEKLMVSAPALAFAWLTAQRREPALPSSRALVTVKAAGTRRSSKASNTRRARFGALRIGRVVGRANTLRSQERSDMGTS